MKVLDRAQSRIPQPWRTILDWFITVAVAVAFVLTFQAQVAKPYRIPSPSMEPTLHCAKPTAFCQGRFSDRVIANRLAYRFGDPKRGQIVVFRAPETAQRCGLSDGGSTFVKRIIGLPGELVSERDGVIYINGDRLIEPYVDPVSGRSRNRQVAARYAGSLLRTRRQSDPLLRLPHLGNGASRQLDRPGNAHVLAAKPRFLPLARPASCPHRSLEGGFAEPKVEAAGIEPASAAAPDRASTSVVCALHSPADRFADRSTVGLAILKCRASGDWLSIGAEPDRLAPLPEPGPSSERRRLPSFARRRVRDRSSHLRFSRLINEADRGPGLAALPENRPRRNLIAPVSSYSV